MWDRDPPTPIGTQDRHAYDLSRRQSHKSAFFEKTGRQRSGQPEYVKVGVGRSGYDETGIALDVNTTHKARHTSPVRSIHKPRKTLCLAEGQAPLVCSPTWCAIMTQSYLHPIASVRDHHELHLPQHELSTQPAYLAKLRGWSGRMAEQSPRISDAPNEHLIIQFISA